MFFWCLNTCQPPIANVFSTTTTSKSHSSSFLQLERAQLVCRILPRSGFCDCVIVVYSRSLGVFFLKRQRQCGELKSTYVYVAMTDVTSWPMGLRQDQFAAFEVHWVRHCSKVCQDGTDDWSWAKGASLSRGDSYQFIKPSELCCCGFMVVFTFSHWYFQLTNKQEAQFVTLNAQEIDFSRHKTDWKSFRSNSFNFSREMGTRGLTGGRHTFKSM